MLPKIFFILKIIQRGNIIYVRASIPVIRIGHHSNLFYRFRKKARIPNLIKIRTVEAELFHADERAER